MTIWKKFRALLAGIELNRRVPRHPAHLWYALLSLFCIPAALVMHGDVRFTVTVTALILPLALVVYVPYRYFNILSRMLLNALIFGAGCFWCVYRMKNNIPMDKMMVETLSLWSLTFLTVGKSKAYFYLLFIDILLLLYAALLPRLLSLYLTLAGFAVILVILFRNRTGFLSGEDGMIAFTSSYVGNILAVEITPDKPIIIQKRAFLACTTGVDMEVFFQKKVLWPP